MRYVTVIMVAVAALITAAPASAQLVARSHKGEPLKVVEHKQKLNLAHARYLCNRGRHATKRWGCHAVQWLTRELKQTETALRPIVATASDIGAWICIHHYEGAWNANTGNGYYGGLQMDLGFQRTYGYGYMRQWGTANNWPAWAQISAARRARDSGRGYTPWPNTARYCGLL